jgi:hypothetical protein
MHFSFNLLRIKSLYIFRSLLAHTQEALHKRQLVYCVRIISDGCAMITVKLQPWHCQLVLYARNIPSATILILIPCILESVENNQQKVLNSILFMVARTCFGKTIPSSRSNYFIRPMSCLLPYWRWSSSERNIVAPWGWHCFTEHLGAIIKNKNKEV